MTATQEKTWYYNHPGMKDMGLYIMSVHEGGDGRARLSAFPHRGPYAYEGWYRTFDDAILAAEQWLRRERTELTEKIHGYAD